MENLRGIYGGSIKFRKKIAKFIEQESKTFTDTMTLYKNHHQIPTIDTNGKLQDLIKVFRSKNYLAQLYQNGNWQRISVNRVDYDPVKDAWKSGISWDELMRIKREIGFGEYDAIEIYPKDKDIVYVTNMRHLFLIPNGINLDCIWRKGES